MTPVTLPCPHHLQLITSPLSSTIIAFIQPSDTPSHFLYRVIAHAGVSAWNTLSDILASLVLPHHTSLSFTSSQRDFLQPTQPMYWPLLSPFYINSLFYFYKASISSSFNIFDLIAACFVLSECEPYVVGFYLVHGRVSRVIVICTWFSFPEYSLN